MKMKVEKSLFQIHFPSSFTIFSSTYGLLVSGVRHFAIAFSYNRIQIKRNVQTRDDPTTIDYAQKKKELKQHFITAAHVLCASLLQKFIFNYLQFYCSLIIIHNILQTYLAFIRRVLHFDPLSSTGPPPSAINCYVEWQTTWGVGTRWNPPSDKRRPSQLL